MNRISRIDGGAFTRRDEAWWEATQLAEAEFRVRLGGAFRGAWLAGLSSRLAERHASIDHSHARLTGEDIWIAELHLIALPGAPDLLELDYVELAQRAELASAAQFELDTHRLIESRAYGGTLMLTLEAPDTLGLLGSLLGGLATLDLFPVEMHIETRGGRAYDSLWLAANGGAPPHANARFAAERLLQSSRSAR